MSIVLLFLCLTALFYLIKNKYKTLLVGLKLAGPRTFPLLGNVQMISKLRPETLFLFITENRTKYRQSFRLWLGPQLWVFLHSPEETRDALNDSSLVKAETFQQLSLLIGNGLLISEGKIWGSHRRALGPAFQPQVLNSFSLTFAQHADILIRKIEAKLDESIEASEILFPCVLDAIIDTSMGKNIYSQQDPQGTYTHAFHNTSELLFKRMVNPLLGLDFIFKCTPMWQRLRASLQIIHSLMDSVIQERMHFLEDFSENDEIRRSKSKSLLDILLTTKIDDHLLTLQEIRDEVNTFVFAGVDTTTAAMSFVLYSLAKYPVEQLRIYREIQEKLSSDWFDVPPETLTAQLNSLEYLDLFIKECLRYYTIVPMTGRQTTRETKIGNITYCSGVTLWINMHGLAHDAELFEDPEEFRPLRFSKVESHKIKAFSYIPFSGGPHVCIGRKYSLLIMKMLTLKILVKFEILLSNPNEKLVLMAQMVLKSLHGINLKFRKRM